MNWSYYNKSKYRDIQNIAAFCRQFGLGRGNSFFLTLTFKENIIDKKESASILNSLLTEIRCYYKDFAYISVAERQKRGAWHYHLLCHSKLVTMKSFKRFLSNIILKSSKPFGFFKCTWTFGENVDRLAHYVGKYLCKLEFREKGVRYVSYSRNFQRVCRLPFMWVTGKCRDSWRLPLRELHKIYGYLLTNFVNSVSVEKVYDLLYQYKTSDLDSFLLNNKLVEYFYGSKSKFCHNLISESLSFHSNSALYEFFSYRGFSSLQKQRNEFLKMEIPV